MENSGISKEKRPTDRKNTPSLKLKKLRWDRAQTHTTWNTRSVTSVNLSRRANESKCRSFFAAGKLPILSWGDRRCGGWSRKYRTLPRSILNRGWKAETWRCCLPPNNYSKQNEEENEVPKIKTNRAAAKRFRVTASGKIKRNKGFKRHLLSSKGKKRKRHLRGGTMVSAAEQRNIRELIPYK
jgi:large subunit ribosomal protein L35